MEDGLSLIPNRILQKAVLDPMRLATGGTLLATRLALQYGWAINLSGGYHHARYNHAGGGCIFGDIQLAVETVWQDNPDARVLIVDLDAHQGNGYEDYFKKHRNTDQVCIFDMYNKNEYPWDEDGSADRIDYPIALDGGQLVCTIAGVDVSSVDYAAVTEHIEGRSVDTDEYLAKLASLHDYIIDLQKAGNGPDVIIYNAGTDPFIEDDWGGLAVSFDGMIQRDQFVWQVAEKNNIPIVMLLSGGYSPKSAAIVAQSIEKTLRNKVGIAGSP